MTEMNCRLTPVRGSEQLIVLIDQLLLLANLAENVDVHPLLVAVRTSHSLPR